MPNSNTFAAGVAARRPLPLKGLSLPPCRATLAAAGYLWMDEGDRRERCRDRFQMGWHAADTPGWGAEGDRPGDVRRRYGDAGTARGQDRAVAARAGPD